MLFGFLAQIVHLVPSTPAGHHEDESMSRELQRLGAALLLSLAATTAQANLITNGDFQSGDFTGWTLFTTASGTLGAPTVTSFDTDGDSVSSLAARFQVGHTSIDNSKAGGGLYQDVTTGAGTLDISMDIAAMQLFTGTNVFGGLFELLVDGLLEASVDLGAVGPQGAVNRDTLNASVVVGAGSHEIRIQITRNAGSTEGSSGTPRQYLDNVSVLLDAAQVAEPASAALLLAGLALLAAGAARRGRTRGMP